MSGELKRNGSGYVNPTAYIAINDAPKGGEIWQLSNGAEILILKNHGTMSTAIKLTDRPNPGAVEVISRQIKYADMRFVQYVFNSDLGQYVKTLPEEQYRGIMESFGDAMSITIKVKKADQTDEIAKQAQYITELESVKMEQKTLIESLRNDITRLESQDQQNSMRISEVTYKALYEYLLDRAFGR